jgi:hypothetical protein
VVVVEEEVAVEAAEAEKVEVVETEGEMTETEIHVEEEARDEVDEGVVVVANPLPTFWTKHLSLLWDKTVAIIKRYLFETEFATSTLSNRRPVAWKGFQEMSPSIEDIITIILITQPFLSYILRYKCVVVPPLFQYKSAYFYFVRMPPNKIKMK